MVPSEVYVIDGNLEWISRRRCSDHVTCAHAADRTITLLFTGHRGVYAAARGIRAGLRGHSRRPPAPTSRGFCTQRRTEVDTQGDSFFVAFTSAAARCRPRHPTFRLISAKGRYAFGSASTPVSDGRRRGIRGRRCPRLCADYGAAHGGQVVLSDATQRMLGDGVSLTDLGEHRLKGPWPCAPAISARRRKVPTTTDAVSDEPAYPAITTRGPRD